jgi:hypothetical protein
VSIKPSILKDAQAAVRAANRALDEHVQEMKEADEAIAAAQCHKDSVAAKGLAVRTRLLAAESALGKAEERAVQECALNLANEIVRRHNHDPLANADWVATAVSKLRTLIRPETETPGNEAHTMHPLISQALGLQAAPDPIHVPVCDLPGGPFNKSTSWATRRRQIINHEFST